MKPIKFPEADTELVKPQSMSEEECKSLWVYHPYNHDAILSCWKPTWRERLAIFFGKPLWLWVSGHSHPPVALQVRSPFDE